MESFSINERQPAAALRIRRAPSAQEIAELVSTASRELETLDVRDVVSIIANTGIRSGELCGLRWEDINFEERYITIRAGRGLHLRRVPFGSKVLEILMARREREPVSEFVFGKSPRLVIERVSRQCRSLSARICTNLVTLHALRLAFYKRWVESGGSAQALGLISGRTYTPKTR